MMSEKGREDHTHLLREDHGKVQVDQRGDKGQAVMMVAGIRHKRVS